MKVVNTVAELHAALANCPKEAIGFVPTMGALHAGHRSLVERARRENQMVVVSVFVNPTQFNDKNDLRNYPRTPEADCKVLEAAGADIVFMPSVEDIYPEPDTRVFDFGLVDKVMEGATRPGHFNGVAQVVSRLFDLVRPKRAYFGEKDFQQIAVIKAMVEQLAIDIEIVECAIVRGEDGLALSSLAIDIEIVECAIVRGEDGLALSSRNELLTPEHRKAAPHIYATISKSAELMATMSPAELTAWVTAAIDSNPLLKTIYFEVVDARTMQRVESWQESERIQGCCAVQAGDIRLIDNIRIK